jgi:hypothetical protein
MSGAIHDNNAWLDRVKEMEDKVAVAEQQSKVANDAINQKTQQKTVIIHEKGEAVTQYIQQELKQHDSECVIPPEFINAHNQSAGERR